MGWSSFASVRAYFHKLIKPNFNKINNKTAVLITGCDSGLGYSFARHCTELGVTVFSCVLDETSLGAVDLKNRTNTHVMHLDVTDRDSVKELHLNVKDIVKTQKYDFLGVVNNAGVMVFGEFEWLTEEQIEHQINVNFLGSARLTKAFLPMLREYNGRLISVSSHCSKVPLPALSVYAASKAAIDAWSSALRMEMEKFGVSVITFTPGSYITQSNIMLNQQKHKEIMEEEMSTELMKLYGDYFNRMNNYLINIPREDGLVYIQDEALMSKFDHALFSSKPYISYVNAPFRYQYYHFLINISPFLFLKNYFIRKYVTLPSWEA